MVRRSACCAPAVMLRRGELTSSGERAMGGVGARGAEEGASNHPDKQKERGRETKQVSLASTSQTSRNHIRIRLIENNDLMPSGRERHLALRKRLDLIPHHIDTPIQLSDGPSPS